MANKDNWKAWVDIQPPNSKGMLHVTGVIKVEDKAKHSLVKAVPQGINPKILLLKVEPLPVDGDSDVILKYEQQLAEPTQYSKVEIIKPAVTLEVEQVS